MRASNRPNPAYRFAAGPSLGLISLMGLALFATGCTQWSHPAKGEREYNSDGVICWQAADESGETKYWPRYHVYKACMIDRGWTDERAAAPTRDLRTVGRERLDLPGAVEG